MFRVRLTIHNMRLSLVVAICFCFSSFASYWMNHMVFLLVFFFFSRLLDFPLDSDTSELLVCFRLPPRGIGLAIANEKCTITLPLTVHSCFNSTLARNFKVMKILLFLQSQYIIVITHYCITHPNCKYSYISY